MAAPGTGDASCWTFSGFYLPCSLDEHLAPVVSKEESKLDYGGQFDFVQWTWGPDRVEGVEHQETTQSK